MNFQQLEYVLAIAAEGNFGRAAFACDITQATLSAMVKKLEEELGVLLFDRSRQPIQLTDDGKAFLPLAKAMLETKSKAMDLGAEELTEIVGEVRIGVIPTIAGTLLPLILPRLIAANPNMQLQIRELITEDIERQLKTGELDFGILATPLHTDDLEEEILYYESMMVYGVQNSALEFISPADLDKHVWLLEKGNCFREQSLTICSIQEQHGDNERLDYEGGSFSSLMGLTDALGGYTLIPEMMLEQMGPDRRAKVKPFKTPVPVREVSLVSYKPHVKRRTSAFLGERIREMLKGKLATEQLANKDLRIIGIS